MPTFDTTAAAALDEEIVRPAFFAFIDFDGDPRRVTTAGYGVTFAGTGDDDLDGFTFDATDPSVVEIGEVTHREGGSETLECLLTGILEYDEETMDLLGARANWQGRLLRLWMSVRGADGAQIGAIVPYYTGYMSAVEFLPSAESQSIKVSVENYLAALTAQPSNRTYQNQSHYDAADTSAQATLGAANGTKSGPAALTGVAGNSVGTGSGRGKNWLVPSLQ